MQHNPKDQPKNQAEEGIALSPKYNDQGLISAIATHYATGEPLMLAHMNAEALRLTLESGRLHFYSRSRQKLWLKGETSGNFLKLIEARIDCDQDALWLRVEPAGPACHTGRSSCFYRIVQGSDRLEFIDE